MLWAPLIVLLGTWCTGSSSQPVLTQPLSVSVSPGNTVKLSCTMSSGTSISDYYKPGNSPRYLLYYYMDSSKGQDTSSNVAYLTISGALAEDEADYYCSAWKGGSAPHCDTVRSESETKTCHPSPPAAWALWGTEQLVDFALPL
uniref:Ig-like domain-containing protein n=1 Tax=Gopherus agassizii TaxID=38772 RepID=A0A452GPM2_9SAUR